MYLKPDIPHPRHFWYLYAKILVKDSITAVVASGVVVALVVNLAVFFINDGSKDGSKELLDQLAADLQSEPFRVVHHSRNLGLASISHLQSC